MTGRLLPEPEAKDRIQALSQEELQAFFDEVPSAAMRLVIPYLPPVDGFRPGSQAGMVRQKEVLAHRLRRPTANDYDYNALYVIWRTWIDETQPNAPLIQSLIDRLEEATDNAEGPEARRLALEEHATLLLKKLKEESQENRLTREAIERLFTFSPLPEAAALRNIISEAKPAADVERDVTFHDLPKRLVQDERKIESINADLNALTERISKAFDELQSLKNAIENARTIAESARTSIDDRDRTEEQRETERVAAEMRLKALAEDVELIRHSLDELKSQRPQLADLRNAIDQLLETHQGWTRGRDQELERIELLQTRLANIETSQNEFTRAEHLAQLAEKIAQLERGVAGVYGRPVAIWEEGNHVEAPYDGVRSEAGRLHWYALETSETATPITTHSDLAAAFARSLQFLGLRPSVAQIFAEECTSAVATRQAIFLRGAFSVRVARALARTVGGTTSVRLPLPIGIQDGADIRKAIEGAFRISGDGVGGLAIEGINHVPFDVTKDIICDCVNPMGDAPGLTARRVVVFATLSRGLAALPVEPEYFELGPVFDLDCLEWRTNVPDGEAPEVSLLPISADLQIYQQVQASNANAEEVIHLARAFMRKQNPAIERTVLRAFHALHVIRSDQQNVMPLHSLFFGWLLPHWSALGLSKEQIDSEFDGGRVQGAPADRRLTAMFEADFSDGGHDHAS